MGTSIEVSGKLSDDRFAKMSRRYEDEQKELTEKIDGVWEQMWPSILTRACSLTMPQPKSPVEIKRRVFLQPFKCYKNTRHGCGEGI